MEKIRKRSLATRVLHAVIFALLLSAAAYFCPTPYQLTAPGPTYVARSIVHVFGSPVRPSEGHFLLLTVVSEPASLLDCCYALFEPAAELTGRDSKPQAADGQDQDDWQMSLSQALAMEVAFDELLGKGPLREKALQVGSFASGSPNQDRLKVGDVFLSLAGTPFHDIRELAAYLQSAKSPLAATVLRDGRKVDVQLILVNQGNRKLLGVVFRPILLDHGAPISVTIDSEKVGGASGGLVFCLEILDQLLPEGLARGRTIAVTGTLGRRGRVGPIEGVRFKRIAAERAGAQLFLCPQENLAELQDRDSGIKVIGVSNIKQALQALQAR